uniref:Uncharacterized protein n=1 Tax=Arundo donax TaxID=35708 RepID=A0A0A9GPT1_ARUDO
MLYFPLQQHTHSSIVFFVSNNQLRV